MKTLGVICGEEFAPPHHQSESSTSPFYVSDSISYSSHKQCGAAAHRVQFGIMDFFFLLVGLISFLPQGLSEKGGS